MLLYIYNKYREIIYRIIFNTMDSIMMYIDIIFRVIYGIYAVIHTIYV